MNASKEIKTKINSTHAKENNNNDIIHWLNNLQFNSLCSSNRIKEKVNSIYLFNPSLSSTKITNKTAYQIIEKRFLFQKNPLDNINYNWQTEVNQKIFTKSKT